MSSKIKMLLKIMNISYQERRRDWPNETRQPAFYRMYGVNSSRSASEKIGKQQSAPKA
jgi:hypothetical protein